MKLNVLPPYLLRVLFCLLISVDAQAETQVQGKEKTKKQDNALSEEFLLFLAEMEEVEGEWVHPIDFATDKPNTQQVATGAVNKSTETENSKPKISEGIDDEKN